MSSKFNLLYCMQDDYAVKLLPVPPYKFFLPLLDTHMTPFNLLGELTKLSTFTPPPFPSPKRCIIITDYLVLTIF